MTTPYEMAINNCKRYLASQTEKEMEERNDVIDAFQMSEILSIAFCKSKEEIIIDLVRK